MAPRDAPGPGQTGSDDRPILVNGTAGFIGSHVALRLLDEGRRIVGLPTVLVADGVGCFVEWYREYYRC